MDDIDKLLEKTSIELLALQEARRRYAPQLAPDFNLFSYVVVDEPRLSHIFADLLKPTGQHNQGSAFLELFLECAGLGDDWALHAARATVKTEARTERIERCDRRIDIVVQMQNDWVFGIENKPWAEDQPDQVRHYAEHLKKCNTKRWHLMYISRRGEPPSQKSIDKAKWDRLVKEKHAQARSYHWVVDWVTRCMGVCASERVRFFLAELQAFIRTEFREGSDMQEREKVLELAMKGPERVEAALQIAKASSDLKSTLFKGELIRQLTRIAESRDLKVLGDDAINPASQYSGVTVTSGQEQKYYFRIEFQAGQYRELIYGLSKAYEGLNNPPAVRAALDEEMGCDSLGKESPQWPWYQYFDEPYRDWTTSERPWMEILEEGEPLAKMIIDKAEAVYKVIENRNLLGEIGVVDTEGGG